MKSKNIVRKLATLYAFREKMHERIAAKCSPQESTILAKEADDSFLACFANEWEMTSNRPPPERSPPKRV